MTDSNPRPYAEQAYKMCVQSGHHDDKTWFCEWCRLLEMRLTPIHEIPAFRELLAEMPTLTLYSYDPPNPPTD